MPKQTAPPITYSKPETWVPAVSSLLKPRMRRGATVRWQGTNLRHLYDDDCEWLALLQCELKIDLEDAEAELAEWLTSTSIQVVHACRPSNPHSYFEVGIRPFDAISFQSVLGRYLGLTETEPYRESISIRVAQLQARANDRCVFLAVDARDLLRTSGHYLIYGSEWLTSALGHECRKLLKSDGVPTLFRVNLPLCRSTASERQQFAHRILREWVRLVSKPRSSPSLADFTFIAQGSVAPDLIVGHDHPTAVRDPLEHFEVYRQGKRRCALCLG